MNKFKLKCIFNVKIYALILLILPLNLLFAQEENDVPTNIDEKIFQKEEIEEPNSADFDIENETPNSKDELPHFPIVISKFRIIPKYYGLPLSLKAGYFYRKSDFSIFPNIAINLTRDDGLELNTSSGIVLQKKFFTWQVDAFYDLWPFTMNRPANEVLAYTVNIFSFYINKSKLSAISVLGNKRRMLVNLNKFETNFELSQGFRLDAFLLDIGYFRSTLTFAFFVDWQPSINFWDYRMSFSLPATFSLYYVDIAFMYSFYGTGRLNSEQIANKKDYAIERAQSIVTGRDSFKNDERYSMLQLFGTEFRWYVFRTRDGSSSIDDALFSKGDFGTSLPKYNAITKTNGFFLSLFGDVGFASTRENKYKAIVECGAGFGYTLFDCIPFTFQVGFNQKFEPVFFLGVISRIVHLP